MQWDNALASALIYQLTILIELLNIKELGTEEDGKYNSK